MFKKNQKPIKRVKKRVVNLQNQLDLFEEWKNEETRKKSCGTSRH